MGINKKSFNNQLEEFYNNRKLKEYYSAKKIMELTGISERTFRYRVKELSEQYKEVPSLLHKKNRKWKIHYSIVDRFQPKYQPREFTLYNLNWKSFITWNTVDRFDNEYHQHLINEVMVAFPDSNFFSAIEKTKKDVNHVHMVSDASPNEIEITINKILQQYIKKGQYMLEVTEVIKKSQSINYLKK
jgi:DNA-binding Lrp family transcriptional regulator